MFTLNKNPPTTATKILEIVPHVMRIIASEMRQSSPSVLPAHFRLLGMLSHRTWTVSELAERHSVSAPTMSNTIKTLEQRGWVTRVRSEEDRRVVLIGATDEGLRIIQQAYERAEAQFADILASLEPDEQEALDRGLDVLHEVFQRAIDHDCPDDER